MVQLIVPKPTSTAVFLEVRKSLSMVAALDELSSIHWIHRTVGNARCILGDGRGNVRIYLDDSEAYRVVVMARYDAQSTPGLSIIGVPHTYRTQYLNPLPQGLT